MASEFEKAALAAGVIPLRVKSRTPLIKQQTAKPLSVFHSPQFLVVPRTQRDGTKGQCPVCSSVYFCKCNSKGQVRFSAYSPIHKSPEGCKSWV